LFKVEDLSHTAEGFSPRLSFSSLCASFDFPHWSYNVIPYISSVFGKNSSKA